MFFNCSNWNFLLNTTNYPKLLLSLTYFLTCLPLLAYADGTLFVGLLMLRQEPSGGSSLASAVEGPKLELQFVFFFLFPFPGQDSLY